MGGEPSGLWEYRVCYLGNKYAGCAVAYVMLQVSEVLIPTPGFLIFLLQATMLSKVHSSREIDHESWTTSVLCVVGTYIIKDILPIANVSCLNKIKKGFCGSCKFL